MISSQVVNASLLIVPLLVATLLPVCAGNLEIDKKRSRIQVDAKATGHSFTGTLDDYSVSANGNTKTNEPTSFSLNWNFIDLKTGEPKRDKEMINWLGGGQPKGSFLFSKTWVDDKGLHRAMGSLAIHGVAKDISFAYTVSKEGEWVTIDGYAQLDYETFSLPIIRAMAVMTVDPKLTVRFHLVGKVK